MSLLGAVYGTLLVNTGKSLFSENFPQLWLYFMGGLFIAVVMLFPNGLAGVWVTVQGRLAIAKQRRLARQRVVADEPHDARGIEAEGKLAETGGK